MSEHQAIGTFDVTMEPQEDMNGGSSGPGRMLLHKQFHGDLVAQGVGQMLTAMTDVSGSAVYVAIERVTGTLHGRAGAFSLYHTGVMERGTQQLQIGVVPDSGTGALAGISGTLALQISGGVHHYTFDYTLPE